MPRYTSAQLEPVRAVMAEILRQFGPLEESVLCLFVNRKRWTGERRLTFLADSNDCYNAVDKVFDSFGDFIIKPMRSAGYFVYLREHARANGSVTPPREYMNAYLELVDEFDALRRKHLGSEFVESPKIPTSMYMKGYYNMRVKLDAMKQNPALLEIPDYYLDNMLGLFDLSSDKRNAQGVNIA